MLGKQGVVERPQTRHMCRKTHEAREPGGGGWKEHTHPAGRPSHPHPTQQRRRPIKHTLLVHEGHSAPPPPCKGPRRETKAAEPPLPPPTHPAPPTSPPTPGGLPHTKATPQIANAHPQRPTITPATEGQGMPASEDTVTTLQWAKPGTQPTLGQAHQSRGPQRGRGGGRSQELPLIQHATVVMDRWRQNRQRVGTVAGLEARHTRAQPQGAADSEQTEADRQTEKDTNRVQPHEANTIEWGSCWWGGPHTTMRGRAQSNPWWGGRSASQPPGPTTGCHHQMPPSTGTIPQHTQDNRLAPPAPLRVLTPTTTNTHPRTTSQPGRTVSLHTPAAPMSPTHTAPHTPPCLRDTTGQQRPGDNTHMRRGQLGPRQRKGAQGSHTRGMRKKARSGGEGPASMHSRGHGTGLQAASGDHKDTRNTAKPPGKPAGGPTTTHTQRQSHDMPGTPTGPSQPQSRPPQPSPTTRASEAPKPIFHHPSSTDSFSI